MGYEVDYSTIPNEFDRREQAMKDLKFQLGGTDRYKRLSRSMAEEKVQGATREVIKAGVEMLLGIIGYPVDVWLDYLGFPQQTPNNPVQLAQTQADAVKLG